MLEDVSWILDLEYGQTQSWTIGRPVKITPYVKARGTGTRTLYNIGDLLKLRVVKELWDRGFVPKAIQAVIDGLEHQVDWSSKELMLITGKGRDGEIQLLFLQRRESVATPPKSTASCEVMDIQRLAAQVRKSATEYLKKRDRE